MTLSFTRVAAAIAVPLTLTIALSGCGGGGRPSADDLASQLQKNSGSVSADDKLSDDAADCVAKDYVDSDISDSGLKKMISSGSDFKDLSSADQKAFGAAMSNVMDDCADKIPTFSKLSDSQIDKVKEQMKSNPSAMFGN